MYCKCMYLFIYKQVIINHIYFFKFLVTLFYIANYGEHHAHPYCEDFLMMTMQRNLNLCFMYNLKFLYHYHSLIQFLAYTLKHYMYNVFS